MSRSLSAIAADIVDDWQKINYAAAPYLTAMATLDSVNDRYFADSGKSIVLYFLSNATSWRGEKARAIKAELKAMIK